MERKEYLEMAQKCAILPCKAYTMKQIPDELKVVYDANEYYPFAYELAFDKRGSAIHIAILHDLNTNSVQKARLELVKKYESEGLK